jgi:hypothetical protein
MDAMVNICNTIIAGETLAAKLSHSTASVVRAIFVGPTKHDENFAQTGTEWSLAVDTAAWSPGVYSWQLWLTTPAGKSVGASGKLTIEPSLADVEAGADNRTTAEKNIEAIETLLAGKATNATKRYRINNRELESYSITELLDLLKYWKGVRTAESPRRPRHLRVSL